MVKDAHTTRHDDKEREEQKGERKREIL